MVERDAAHQRSVDGALSKMKYAVGDLNRAQQKVRRVVGDARAAGATWAEIGTALGMTGQGAQKRFGSKADRAQANALREQVAKRQSAAKRCPRCDVRFPSAVAVKAHVKAAECADSPGLADPWPDGTVQGTIDADDNSGAALEHDAD